MKSQKEFNMMVDSDPELAAAYLIGSIDMMMKQATEDFNRKTAPKGASPILQDKFHEKAIFSPSTITYAR